MRRVRVADLPLPAASLDVRDGCVVSVLQAPEDYASGRPVVGPGLVCVHEGMDLTPRVIARSSGFIMRAQLAPDGQRIAVVTQGDPPDVYFKVTLIALDGTVLAERKLDGAYDCAWWRGHLAIGTYNNPWTEDYGAKVEIWTDDLARCVDALYVNDAGFSVSAEKDVIVSNGIDVHVWWPEKDSSTSIHEHFMKSIPGEMGSAVLSRDASLTAFVHDLWRAGEPQAVIVRNDELDAGPVFISDGTRRYVRQVTFSPDASKLAVKLSDDPEVRIHASSDGSLLETAQVEDGAIAWLDNMTLLVGRGSLTAWKIGA